MSSIDYKKDPSRYLPGDVTPFLEVKMLSANTALSINDGSVHRFFPRAPLSERGLSDGLIDEVANIFLRQAELVAGLGRPIRVATTAGRDSRVSVASFSGFKNVELFSFHIASTGTLTEDVQVARSLSRLTDTELSVYDLGCYRSNEFSTAFSVSNPIGIWPTATLCYIEEFPENSIHVRSTVSEIGRVFYGRTDQSTLTARQLAAVYTGTAFGSDLVAVNAIDAFMRQCNFDRNVFFNYDPLDLFYWEHRNTKWQSLLCQEAEMATDVFIPFNNRSLIKLFLSLPFDQRRSAILHREITISMLPQLRDVPYIS
jgi:hypothetical protein